MLAVIVVAAVVVIALLVNNGTIKLSQKETTSASAKSYTTDVVNPFKDTITIKGTYIFYEGAELDDIGSLEREIKYQDSDTTFTVQDEHADSNFLNKEVLPLLTKYKMKYNVTHIQSSGLISKYEATTQAVSDTAPSSDAQVSDAQPPHNDFMDIELLANKINLNSELKNKVLSLVERDRAKLISLCKKADNDNFKSVFTKNDMIKLAVALLYSVEFTYPKYQKAVISDEIYFETMKDIAVWCENNNNKGLKNLPWIKNHLNFELFKLGRLQFQFYKCNNKLLDYSLFPFDYGEKVVYVHIPQGEKLVYAECVNSLKNAKSFFCDIFRIMILIISFVKAGFYTVKIGNL